MCIKKYIKKYSCYSYYLLKKYHGIIGKVEWYTLNKSIAIITEIITPLLLLSLITKLKYNNTIMLMQIITSSTITNE